MRVLLWIVGLVALFTIPGLAVAVGCGYAVLVCCASPRDT